VSGVIVGFTTIAGLIGLGYLLALRGTLGKEGAEVLARAAFSVAGPALMFEKLAEAELSVILSPMLAVTALTVVVIAGVFAGIGLLRGWGAQRTVVGSWCASYVNAAMLGIPVAAYVLGDASLVAPVLLLQLLVLTPAFLTLLDMATSTVGSSPVQRLAAPLRNPVLYGCLLGVLSAVFDVTLPPWVAAPVALLGDMAVPAMLLAYGLSLRGRPWPGRSAERGPVLLASALKVAGAPLVSWVIGTWVVPLDDEALFAVVVLAALPTAQNVFTYALRYRAAVQLCSEIILVSTALSLPALVGLGLLAR
jgi:malonate transporter and related proteins